MSEPKHFTPRPWQPGIMDFMYKTRRGNVFADVGMGKTPCGLTVYDNLLMAGYETKPLLVLGTLRIARKVWSDEVKKWDHLTDLEVVPLMGTPEERLRALKRDVPINTINYEQLPWLIQHFKDIHKSWPYGMLMPDESTRLSGLRISIRTSKLGKKWAQGGGTLRAKRLAHMAWDTRDSRLINFSGTPTPNNLHKLYGPQWFVDFGRRLGNSYSAFEQRYFKRGYDGYGLEMLPGADKLIHEAVKDVCIAVLAKDWLDLEKPLNVTIPVELPKRARALYREMKKNLYIQFGERQVEALNAGSKAVKLLQLASGAVYLDPETEDDDDPRAKDWVAVHDEKMQALEDVLEEMGGGPIIVAYQFRSTRERLKKNFPKMRFLDTIKDENDFKKGKIQGPFGVHPASGAHGIDGFQYVTNKIFFFDQWPDMELRDQVIGRIGPVRQYQAGFKRPVYIYDCVAIDTRDEDVISSHGEKAEIQNCFLDAMRR